MDYLAKLTGQDPESKLAAAEAAVETKKKELADAEAALAALKPASSGTIDGVQGGRRRRRKTRKTTSRRK
jgi:hypothetical protein